MPEETKPRKRPTEIAIEIVEPFIANPLGSPLDVPSGLRWSLKVLIADAIRRERVVIFKLRDAAEAAAGVFGDSRAELVEAVRDRLREAVESSLTDEDLNLPRFDAPLFSHVPSARVGLLEVVEFTPGRLTFRFEDTYSGKDFSLTFDAGSDVLCQSRIEGASLDQLGAMLAFCRGELLKRKGA